MPTVYSSWVPNSTTNQRMRLVLDYSTSNTSDTVTRVSWTVRVEAGYSFNDSDNTFTRGGSWPAGGRSLSINVATNGSQTLESNGADATREYGGGTRTLSFSLTGIEYVGISQTATVSASIPIPARPISAPLAPSSISVTRVSDSANTINWAASSSDARPIWNFNLQLQEMGGDWATLGNPAASTRSWPSQSQQPNRAYRYRVRTSNGAGQSSWVTSGWVYNTPSAASNVRASRSGDSLAVSWTNNVWAGFGSNATHDVQLSSRVGSGSWSSWSNASGHTGLSRTTTSRTISGGLDLTREWRARVVTRVPGRSATSSASGSVEFYNPPPALTSLTVTRSSDASNRLNWSFSGSGTSAATSFTIQRWMHTDQTYRTVGTATGGSRSWTDTVNLWNNRARWRVRANNPAGSSAWVYSPYQPGTPYGATTPTVTRSGANAVVSWSNQARYSESISLWASSAPAGTTGWAPWAALTGHTGLSPSTTQRTISGLDSTRLWRFQVRTHATTSGGTVLTGNSGISATLQLPAAPAAPTPQSPVVTQAAGDVTFRWRHNPIDGSAQQGFRLQFRLDGGDWVTREVASTVSAHTETLDVGTLEWRVATRGQHASYGPYSGTTTVEVAQPPAATITHPTDTIRSNRVTLTWTYSDPQDASQAWWMAELTLPGGLTEQKQGTTQRSVRFDTDVPDDTEVELTLWVTSGTGLTSEPATVTQLVHYLRPAQPIIYAEWAEGRGEVALAASEGGSPVVWVDPEQGLVQLPGTTLHEGDGQYSNDAVEFIDHGEGRIEVVGEIAPTALVRFERSDDDGATWVEVSGPVTLTDAVSDWQVALNREPLYRALAISDLEVEVASAPVRVSTATNRVWLHTAAGDSLSLEGNVELGPTLGADLARVRYLGDIYPTTHYGIGIDEQVAVTGTWFSDDPELTTDETIRQVLGRPVWFRDPSGRAWWASIDPMSGRQPWARVREASFTAVRTEAPRG